MPTVFLDAVFKPFFKVVHDTGQQLTILSEEFPDGRFPSNHATYGVCECKHAISNTSKGKKNHTLKDQDNEGATARLRNGKWGARETCFEQWSLTRLQCALWYHLVESGQPRGKECRPPRPRPSAYLLNTTHSKDIRFPWVTLYLEQLHKNVIQKYVQLLQVRDVIIWTIHWIRVRETVLI